MFQKVYSPTKKKRTPTSQIETHQSRTDHACPAIKLVQSHLLRHFPYLNQSRNHLVAVCHVSCCQSKFQSIFNPCNPLQQTMGNNIIQLEESGIPLKSAIRSPSSTDNIQYPVPGLEIHAVESRDSKTVLDTLTWGDSKVK